MKEERKRKEGRGGVGTQEETERRYKREEREGGQEKGK